MRFLIDNALSPLLAERLRTLDHDAVHVRELGMAASPDSDIFELAKNEQRIIVSADTDFAEILSKQSESFPSLILFRRPHNRRPEEQVELLELNLAQVQEELGRGCVVVIKEGKIRIRELPFR